MRRLLTSLICAVAIHATAQTPVAIQVDLSKPVGAYKPIYSWFGYDESNSEH
jgi:xylan 1,4-beta-xylosidase